MEKGQLARALYSNTPESQYELFFRKGDILTVLEFDPDGQTGWWLCALRGERGLCPGNYLELMENRFSTQSQLSSPIMQDEVSDKQNALEAALDTYDVPRPYVRPESPLSKSSPLELYDVPRSHIPIYAVINKSTQLKNRQNNGVQTPAGSGRASVNSKRASDLSLMSNGSSFSASSGHSSSSGASYMSFHSANSGPASSGSSGSMLGGGLRKLSEQQMSIESSASGSSGGGGQDPDQEYDVPRPSIRAQSAMALSNAGSMRTGLNHNHASNFSIASTATVADSQDDQIEVYDVPRPSTKALAAQFIETKYDRVNGGSSGNNNSSPPVIRRHHNNSNNPRLNNQRYSTGGSASMYGNDGYHAKNTLVTNGSTASLPQMMRNSNAAKRAGQILSQDFKVESLGNELYDVPPSQGQRQHTPFTSVSTTSLFNSRRRPSIDSLKKGKSSDSFEKFCERATAADLESRRRASILFGSDGGSNASSQQNLSMGQDDNGPAQVKTLPLSPKAAVSVCEKLRQEVVTSINSILQFVQQPRWRQKENLAEIMPEVRFGCVRLNLAIKDLTAFCSRTVTNANKPGTETIISARLQRLLTPLIRSSRIIERDVEELEAYAWSVDRLSIVYPSTGGAANANKPPLSSDALDQLALCAQSLTHDVTEMANFIALNSTTLFREEPPPPPPQPQNNPSQPAMEPEPRNQVVEDEDYADCDYVTLAPIAEVSPRPSNIPRASSPIQSTPQPPGLDLHDSQILEFYSTQIATCAPLLSQSISKFITSVQNNDSPKIFNGHLKYVILLAYKMLFIGDTVHSNITNEDLKEQVQSKSDELHRAVVALHDASKRATQEFPKIVPMQAVVDHVWQTTATANQLKSIIYNATCL